jgi:NADH-quinone oxidoreductase subunit N
VKAMFIVKSDNPIETFKSDASTKLAMGICIAGIVITGFASIIFEVIRNLSFGV